MDKIINSKGESVAVDTLLNDREMAYAEKLTNALSENYGYLVPMTTLTALLRDVAEQKFYQVPVADYMPVRVGTEAAWAEDILMFRSFQGWW